MSLLSSLSTRAARRITFLAVVAVLVVADQVTKFWAVGALSRAFDTYGSTALSFTDRLDRFLFLKHPGAAGTVAVIDDFWHFRYAENAGAAFSFLGGAASTLRTPFLLLVSFVAMVFIAYYYRRTRDEQLTLRVGLAMVFAGALGNFLDRIRLGYVIDFIDWHLADKFTWPTFNVADAAITVGVGLLVLDMLRSPRTKSAEAGAAAKVKGG